MRTVAPQWIVLRRSLAIGVSVAAIGIVLLFRHGLTALETAPWHPAASLVPTSASWEDVIAEPGPISVESWVTGIVDGDRFVVLDENAPQISQMGDRFAPSVVLAYLVRHETKGDFLVDAGLGSAFARGGGNYTTLLSLLLSVVGAEPTQVAGTDVAARLAARGITPKAVFLTHLHGDHTGRT